MSEKISVKEFIKKYNALTSDEGKKDFIRLNIINKYIPYENKITICDKVVESTYYIKIKEDTEVEIRKLHINSAATYMLYRLNIINSYTSINIDFKNSLEEYNSLNKSGLVDIIFDFIPEKELKEFNMLLEMAKSDLISNEYETKAFISGQVERFAEIFGTIISPGLEQLGKVIENMDDKTIDNIALKAQKIARKFL